jgi:hypothetical protein
MKRPSVVAAAMALFMGATFPILADEKVTVDNFTRAETDRTLHAFVEKGAFGKFLHFRVPTPIDKQDVIRMNRDTLYSVGVFDLTSPVTIVKPDSGGRFQSLQIISQDHSMKPSIHESGEFTFTQKDIGTRYLFLLFRTFIDSNDEADVKAANALQDRIVVKQKSAGKFDAPKWDEKSLSMVRDAINVLASTKTDISGYFGDKSKLNAVDFLLGSAFGWGGNPKEAAIYVSNAVEMNDGKTSYSVTLRQVPVDGFWSITVYNKDGFMEKNEQDAYNFNNVTAQSKKDGSVTINFGKCDDNRTNCLPITEGWNYTLRLYQPKQEIIDGSWKSPDLEVAK